MPLLFESTEATVRHYGGKLRSFKPDITSNFLWFTTGVLTGFIILPIALPIAGYQLTRRYGPPPPPSPRPITVRQTTL